MKTKKTAEVCYMNKQDKAMMPISKDQYLRIMDSLDLNDPYRLAIMLGYHAGLRLCEALALTWDRIDLDRATITIDRSMKQYMGLPAADPIGNSSSSSYGFVSTKTVDCNRKVTIGQDLVDELRRIRTVQQSNEVLYGTDYFTAIPFETADHNGNPVHLFHSVQRSRAEGLSIDLVCLHENGMYLNLNDIKQLNKKISANAGFKFSFPLLRHLHMIELQKGY